MLTLQKMQEIDNEPDKYIWKFNDRSSVFKHSVYIYDLIRQHRDNYLNYLVVNVLLRAFLNYSIKKERAKNPCPTFGYSKCFMKLLEVKSNLGAAEKRHF